MGTATGSGPAHSSTFEGENGVLGAPSMEDSSAVPSSGTLRMRANGPQGRLRSLDYSQVTTLSLGLFNF